MARQRADSPGNVNAESVYAGPRASRLGRIEAFWRSLESCPAALRCPDRFELLGGRVGAANFFSTSWKTSKSVPMPCPWSELSVFAQSETFCGSCRAKRKS